MAFVGKVEEDEKEDVEKLDFPAGKASPLVLCGRVVQTA